MLGELDGEPVLVRDGRVLVASFHPELTDDTRVHELFLRARCGRGDDVSGHSKWSSIKHKKGAADAKRGKLFSKLSRAIIVAAREGGADPAANLALAERDREGALLLDAEGQHRARDREGRRARAPTARRYETVVYEGYGPEGVAVIVEALTDNRNRTASDVRHLFTKHGGNLGATGAVAWQFERRGVVLVAADGVDEDELLLAAAEAGADDVERDGSTFQVTSAAGGARRRARGARGGRLHRRVGRAVDGAEDDRRDRRRERPRRRSCASSRGSRTTTTSRTSTRTSTSRSGARGRRLLAGRSAIRGPLGAQPGVARLHDLVDQLQALVEGAKALLSASVVSHSTSSRSIPNAS